MPPHAAPRAVPSRTAVRRLAAGAVATAAVLAPLSAGTAQAASAQVGWVRLAHLSPDTPPVDVYLYPFGTTEHQIVLKHVAYGTASAYESLPGGLYVVAMRSAGASASASPVISTEVSVAAGQSYTVAGLGPFSALKLDVLHDQLDAPSGKSSVRLIEASLTAPAVSITAGGDTIAENLHFPAVTGYQTVGAGDWSVHVTTRTDSSSSQVDLAPNDTYTLAVLDGPGGAPRVLDLTDAASTTTVPVGGVDTGFGGTAGGAGGSPAADAGWAALLLAGVGGALYAGKRLRSCPASPSDSAGTAGRAGRRGRNGSATSMGARPEHPHTGSSVDVPGVRPGEVTAPDSGAFGTGTFRPGGDAGQLLGRG
jgi:Domain of unknown function (DUF4397)